MTQKNGATIFLHSFANNSALRLLFFILYKSGIEWFSFPGGKRMEILVVSAYNRWNGIVHVQCMASKPTHENTHMDLPTQELNHTRTNHLCTHGLIHTRIKVYTV